MSYLKELVVEADASHERQGEFDLSVNCVIDLYFASLPKRLDTGPFRKIVLVACEGLSGSGPLDNLINVVRLRMPFDFSAYWNADKLERKRRILDFAHGGLMVLCEKFGWSESGFVEAYNAVVSKDFVYRRLWGKPSVSPDKKKKAQYFIDFDSDSIRVDAVVMRSNGEEIGRQFITSVKPHWFFINDTLLPMKWLGVDAVSVSTRDGKQSWIVRP